MRGFVLGLALVLGALGQAWADGHERILDFQSRIQIHADGSMTVSETIRVQATGNQIKRGIYREFPTLYEDRFGNDVRVRFDVREVRRDGRAEPYHIRQASNGERVYIGQKDVFLEPGVYTYTLVYETDRQLGFFDDFDELYWNVTGSGWAFEIERASATIILPHGAELLETAAYTGPQGARDAAFSVSQASSSRVDFATTRPLPPGHGLTVAVSWPKGFVAEPSAADRLGFVLGDNGGLLYGLVGLAFVLAYYLFAWGRVGRDPPTGTIVPLFAPPEGFTPAAVRFVMRMGFDHKVFAAAIVIMAVKGYLTIDDSGGAFVLRKTGADESVLNGRERRLAGKLFGSDDEIEFKNKNHAKVGAALKAFKKDLRNDFERLHFVRNRAWLVPGAVITMLAISGILVGAGDPEEGRFIVVWLTLWTFGTSALAIRVATAWKGGRQAGTLGFTLFALPFFAGEIFGLGMFADIFSLPATALLVALVAVNVAFYQLLKAPTLHGRAIMDRIEGFRLFLSVAERERLNTLNPPERTPELFEKYLPYAMALDVENAWGEQFAGVLDRAGRDAGYRPSWYAGRAWRASGPRGFASNLGGAFAGAIAASSVAPGSSSGSGGGGFSGGGGGGGGGGGW